MWLPWDCVPKANGARNGGTLIKTDVLAPALCYTQQCMQFSPDGMLLAVAFTGTTSLPFLRPVAVSLTLRLLHWRTGELLNSCTAEVSLLGMALHAPRVTAAAPRRISVVAKVDWAQSGGAVHVGCHAFDKSDRADGVSANLIMALDDCC